MEQTITATSLTSFALYSALAEQVYRRACIKYSADQPLAISGDGGDATGSNDQIPGQTLVDPEKISHLDTDPLTAGRFLVDNNYIYDTSSRFMAIVTSGDNGYTVTFRGTDVGMPRF